MDRDNITNKIDYKNTLHLPKTKFPMKANLAGLESLIKLNFGRILIFIH